MSRQAGCLAQCGLYGDCYALCLPLCLFGFRSQVNASVGRGCLLCRGCFVGRVCVFWGLAIGGMSIGAIASSYLARGTSQTPGCLYVVGATGAAAHCFFCCFLCFEWAVWGFPCFPCVFCPLLFGSISLGFSSPLGSGGVGGHTAGRGLSRVGYVARDVAEDLLCFLFFLLLQLATGS